jgi:hypothetical protein
VGDHQVEDSAAAVVVDSENPGTPICGIAFCCRSSEVWRSRDRRLVSYRRLESSSIRNAIFRPSSFRKFTRLWSPQETPRAGALRANRFTGLSPFPSGRIEISSLWQSVIVLVRTRRKRLSLPALRPLNQPCSRTNSSCKCPRQDPITFARLMYPTSFCGAAPASSQSPGE